MNTVALYCIIHAETLDKQTISDILIAQLAELGYHGFEETPEGINAYIDQKKFDPGEIQHLPIRDVYPENIEIYHRIIAEKNWNKLWEEGFQPVTIGNDILIRASFHPEDRKYPFQLIIEPKMSFGTGHHSTTYLMLQWLLEIDLKGKIILDMGCGTGILSIMAAMKGAKAVWAVDTDEWAWQNAQENLKRNKIENVEIIKGNIQNIPEEKFDLILANINLNTLLQDIPAYVDHIDSHGHLIVSGIYRSNRNKILEKAKAYGLKYEAYKEKNLWIAVKFVKLCGGIKQ
jgi:ribosomal protein L11 methyltransferase